jgi:hypothetical protein
MENWSWIEVIWTLVAATGAYFSANNIRDGIGDLVTLNKLAQPGTLESQILRVTAWGNTRRDSLRETIQILFLILGLWVGFTPPAGPISLFGYIFSFTLIIASSFLTISALGDHRDRVKMQELGRLIALRDIDVRPGN